MHQSVVYQYMMCRLTHLISAEKEYGLGNQIIKV